jgi:hypothetical protein
MSTQLIHLSYAGLAPWLALTLLLLGRSPHLKRSRILVSLILSFVFLCIPIRGFSSFRWISVIEPSPSFILTGLLALRLIERLRSQRIFQQGEWRTAWLFGTVAALLLYPMGLGLTTIDPYAWGWGAALPIATTLIATLLLLRGNQFGALLLLPLVGYWLHFQESSNFWDAVVDPFYALSALLLLPFSLMQQRKA